MEDRRMSLLSHLDELRTRLLVTIAWFILMFLLAFIFIDEIFHWLIKDLDMSLAVLGPTDILWMYLRLAGAIAIMGTVPVLAGQIWMFVSPGLTPTERKLTLAYIPAVFILFIAGVSFAFFIVLPIILNFILSLGDEMFETMFTADKYLRFILQITLPFGFLFILPVVVMFLTQIGLISPKLLKKNRKIAYFSLVVVSVLVSPPDFLSDLLVCIPLIFLYELSVVLSAVIYRRQKAREKFSRAIELSPHKK